MTAFPASLVEAAGAGDSAALTRLLVVSQPDLRRYARRLCASKDVEEAVQDALWLLYSRVGGLRTVAAFSGWLFQIVRRACQRLARQRTRVFPGSVPLTDDLTDSSRADDELRMDLVRAMTRLPPAYRQVLVLRDILGESAEDTAAAIGISVEGAKSRLHRARGMMRELLANGSAESKAG